MSKCLEISCIIHSTILNDFCHITHRSTMQIVFPNMQAALDHIEEHKEMEVVIVQSHDGTKADILKHRLETTKKVKDRNIFFVNNTLTGP